MKTLIDFVVKARRCSGEQPSNSLLFCSSRSPLRVSASLPPLGRVSVCLCAQGFDTAIQALWLPWHRMPYKASGVKEHRVGCSHTHTHTHVYRKNAWLPVSPLTPGQPGSKGELTPTLPRDKEGGLRSTQTSAWPSHSCSPLHSNPKEFLQLC